ncbi:hypothetical protein [Hyphomicrobium sp. DY-1]|uniref:hypothetical protein n=1 Tax=Hyphomicrobium sp. DY-1 TaxID=3075650 RepID=UPI0039C20858
MAFKYAHNSDSEFAGLTEYPMCRVVRYAPSGKAVLLRDAGGDFWLPLSKIQLGPVDKRTETLSVYVPEWLARGKKYV